MPLNISGLALEVGHKSPANKQKPVDIITFVEAPWGLNQKLYPVQRVILKAHYGLALDDNPWGIDITKPVPKTHPNYAEITTPNGNEKGFYKHRVVVTDWKRENLRVMTEAAYLHLLYREGRCNIKEVVPGQERREMVLAVGRRSGKCVRGDTLVLTDQGIFPIQDLGDPQGAEIQPVDLTVAQEGKGARGAADNFYNGGVRETLRFKTRSGFELEGTPNHRVKVMSPEGEIVWRYLEDLQEGDQVCIHRNTDLWASKYLDVTSHHPEGSGRYPVRLDEDLGLLLGYLVGDGTWGVKDRIEMTVGDLEAWGHSRELFTRVFSPIWKEYRDARRSGTGTLRVFRKRWRAFLNGLGYSWDVDRDTKSVPWAILRSPRSVVRAFLRGLFETDGGVENGGRTVSFSTSSEVLGREVQILLLNLGIVSTRSEKVLQEKSYWVLRVRGLNSRRKFADLVGFVSSRKMDPLLDSLNSRREGGDTESIPHLCVWARKFLGELPVAKPGQGWSRSSFRKVLRNTIKPSSRGQMTYPRAKVLLALAQEWGVESPLLGHLQGIVDADYFFDPVTQIEGGECPVFDLTVPSNHEFVANGMTNHNTHLAACIAAYETYKLLLKGDPQFYYGLPVGEVLGIISVATDKEQAGILYSKVSGYYKECFAGETPIITGEGVRPIGELVGTIQNLLTTNGAWVDAPIRSFGEKRLWEVVLRRQGVEKTLYTTENHRWFARNAQDPEGVYSEFFTFELCPSRHLLRPVYEKDASHWTVISVEPTDRVEEVFCATVEGTEAFALEGNILTGNCPFFDPYTANNTMSYARFQTPKDIERYGRYADDEKANATIKVNFRPCRAKGLRGPGNLVVILDEMAHFTDSGQSSAELVYNAVSPSISAFSPKDPQDHTSPIGDVEGRIISISSPLGRQGQFYKLYQIGFAGGTAASNILSIQAPTWEVNPTVPASEFAKNYVKDPIVFFTEYGAYFTDRTRGWIENSEDLLACVDPNLRPNVSGISRLAHFIGIDFALAGDGTAVAIGHINNDNKIVLDYLDWIRAGEGDFEDYDRLDFDEVADWVADLARRFNIHAGLFDQWSGIVFEQALQKRGLKQIVSTHFTKQTTSQIYKNFKDMMYDERLVLYNWPLPENAVDGDNCGYIQELLELQSEVQSKYITVVEAPNMAGKHDDRSDALVRMVWAASQNLTKSPYFAGSASRGKGGQNNPQQAKDARNAWRKTHRVGGSSPDRQPSRIQNGTVRGRRR